MLACAAAAAAKSFQSCPTLCDPIDGSPQAPLSLGFSRQEHWSRLQVCEMSANVRQFGHYLALPFFGIGMKLTFSSPVATVEFPKFAGILSAALSQHHLLGFETAQLDSIASTRFVHSDVS